MRGVQTGLDKVGSAAGGSHASMGRLGQEMVTLTRRMLGLNPVVAQAANVLGGLALGTTATIGILAGVAAVGFAFNKLTESSRKAMDAGDKLIETYNKAARISALGGQQKADIEDINKGMAEHARWLNVIIGLRERLGGATSGLGGLVGLLAPSHQAQLTAGATARAAAEQQRVNALGLQNAKDNEAFAQRIKDANEKAAAAAKKAQSDFLAGITSSLSVFDNLAAHGTASSTVNARLIADYQKLAAQIRDMGDASGPAVAELLKLRDALMANLVVAQAVARANATGTVGPLVGKTLPGVSLTPNAAISEAVDKLQNGPMARVGSPSDPLVQIADAGQEQLRKDEAHTQLIHDAIWGAAAQSASMIVSALNIGGGGRGSGLGGALGGTAGFALGYVFGGGPVGGAIGSTIGNIIGSAVGGLFDHHKRAVDHNTQALQVLTQAIVHNAPSGFKVASYRYDATDVQAMGNAARRYAARGGKNPLLVGT